MSYSNQDITIAFAESLTGGAVMSKMTEVSGISNYFKGGLVCYCNDSKIKLLDIPENLVNPCNGVSAKVSEQMAINITNLFGTVYGISTTGYAETYKNNLPQVYISFYNSISKDCITFYITYKESVFYIERNGIVNILPINDKADNTYKIDRNGFREVIASFIKYNITEIIPIISATQHDLKTT